MAAADPQGADAVRRGIRCMLMRGGTSKGAYFLAADLPADSAARDDLLLRIMGSPDPRQIDGIGGAHPLTSKVAVVAPSTADDVDVDYLFLQVGIEEPIVGTAQTCGNLLAGVGPFAVERGLVRATGESTTVRIRLLNTGDIATSVFTTSDGLPDYDGADDAVTIDGVPGTASAIHLEVGGGPDKPLLPTGRVVDEIDGHRVTLIDNGMPVAVLRADDLGVDGTESPADLEADAELSARIEQVRLAAGPRMGLGDVRAQTVPKMILVSPARAGGALSTRAFIPSRVHTSIGVLMAASVAAAVRVPGTIAAEIAGPVTGEVTTIEHPSGDFPARVHVSPDADGTWRATSASLRTARKLFDGLVFPRSAGQQPPSVDTPVSPVREDAS
ncbi:4-oxalomesaconate tautomerase [Microbacterium yannicii]|uniref:4-oxalomesaconate tautomerase n=1 Tax=Microbacterium yannicii TaxID=671622 RepID=UPI0002F3B13A|nr:4-oxalomesaconate tautomerase [Microbacterium yannicii]